MFDFSGNIDDKAGEVKEAMSVMNQEQVDELVERFYQRLSNDSYFRNMFAERNVDLDWLKDRQRMFIARLANIRMLTEDQEEVRQVQERHHFGVDPERAESWFDHLKKTMEEMELESDIMNPLLDKIKFLIDKMIEKSS